MPGVAAGVVVSTGSGITAAPTGVVAAGVVAAGVVAAVVVAGARRCRGRRCVRLVAAGSSPARSVRGAVTAAVVAGLVVRGLATPVVTRFGRAGARRAIPAVVVARFGAAR